MDPQTINKYLYIDRTPTWLIRVIYGVGIVTWFILLYGYYTFYTVNPLFFWIIAPAVFFLFSYHVLSYSLMLFYEQFDIYAHKWNKLHFNLRTLSLSKKEYPRVDIFLPICGEDTDVIANTFAAVSKLDYPNFSVYVLDDRGEAEHKALALHCNFTYLSRDNKGEMKKAGNLKYGFERSSGDFIAIFDADFAPHPDFIRELLPLMADPKVAIVQTPQYFKTDTTVHKDSMVQYGAAHVQEDFYRFIQVARSRLGAPICCGSNALYRRSALQEIGGTTQIEHSEDAYTGFELSNCGYKILYVPIILAIGLCPDNLHSYFHQQHRWCSGSLNLMLDKAFWRSRLTLLQKLCYISGYMYYLSHPVTLLMSFQVFFVLYLYSEVLNFYDAIPFLICIVFSLIAIPAVRITKMRFGGYLARNAYVFTYSHAVVVAFMKQSLGWQPTNSKRMDISKEYMQQLHFVAAYFLLYVGLFTYSLSIGTINIFAIESYTLLFWVFYTLINTGVILVYLYLYVDETRKKLTPKPVTAQYFGWSLKAVGMYTSLLLCFMGSGVLLGNIKTEGSSTVQSISKHVQMYPALISQEILHYSITPILIANPTWNSNSDLQLSLLLKKLYIQPEILPLPIRLRLLSGN